LSALEKTPACVMLCLAGRRLPESRCFLGESSYVCKRRMTSIRQARRYTSNPRNDGVRNYRGCCVREDMQDISVRDLLNVAWICMRRSIETNDARTADELDRLACVCVTEARRLNPSLMETYAPSPTMH